MVDTGASTAIIPYRRDLMSQKPWAMTVKGLAHEKKWLGTENSYEIYKIPLGKIQWRKH